MKRISDTEVLDGPKPCGLQAGIAKTTEKTNGIQISLTLPEEPVVRIRPSHSWVALDLRELWAYRELLYFLAWRDVKVRYKQAALGIAWAIIQPLFTMLVFAFFFGKMAKIPSEGVPYPLFSYAALLPWTFFMNAVTNSGNSLVGSANLITKIYFPRLIVPGAAVVAALVDFAISSAVFFALLAYYRYTVTWGIIFFPLCVILIALLALGIGLWTSAINVKYRDIRYALPFILQLWMFVSPVIYPTSLMPKQWQWLLTVNPLTGIIESFRSCLLGRPLAWGALSYSCGFTILFLLYAAYAFRRMEKQFADII